MRISVIRVNLDDMAAQLDMLHTPEQKADWLAGFRFALECHADSSGECAANNQPMPSAPGPAPLSLWIRTRTSDPDRTQENQESLAGLIRRFSLKRVQDAAERIVAATHQKIWPDDERLLSQLIGSTVEANSPQHTPEDLPDDLRELPDGHPLKPKERK